MSTFNSDIELYLLCFVYLYIFLCINMCTSLYVSVYVCKCIYVYVLVKLFIAMTNSWKKQFKGRKGPAMWLVPEIPVIYKMEIGRTAVLGQPGQKLGRPLPQQISGSLW
jgi:hypothetical protein